LLVEAKRVKEKTRVKEKKQQEKTRVKEKKKQLCETSQAPPIG
jgi:hypothetical protein